VPRRLPRRPNQALHAPVGRPGAAARAAAIRVSFEIGAISVLPFLDSRTARPRIDSSAGVAVGRAPHRWPVVTRSRSASNGFDRQESRGLGRPHRGDHRGGDERALAGCAAPRGRPLPIVDRGQDPGHAGAGRRDRQRHEARKLLPRLEELNVSRSTRNAHRKKRIPTSISLGQHTLGDRSGADLLRLGRSANRHHYARSPWRTVPLWRRRSAHQE
jgi:hypothetical protein